MKAIEGTVYNGIPPARISPKIFSSSLIAYHNTQGQLLQVWLSHINGLEKPSSEMPSFPFVNFSADTALIKAVLKRKGSEEFTQEKECIIKFLSDLQRHCLNSLPGQGIARIEGVLMSAKQHIAQLIFLADRDILAAVALLEENMLLSLEKIDAAFDSHVQEILQSLRAQTTLHDSVPIQNSTLAAVRKKPMLIADLLLTSTGHLNMGLVDLIKCRFFDQKLPLMHHEKELIHTLDILAESSRMQNKLHAVVKPFSPYLPSNDILRVSLGLPPETPLQDRHAKLAVLAALLSNLRQGEVGGCFGTSVAIMMMDPLKERVLDDLISLIGEGKVIREGRRPQKDFIPVLDISDSALQSTMTIESSGKCVSGTGYVWEAPGLTGACRQLGLEGKAARKAIRKAIGQIYESDGQGSSELLELTPEAVLKQVIRNLTGQLQATQRRNLKYRAYLAFNNETHCPLLRAWESCLLSMAEDKSNNKIKRKIAQCIASVIEPQWPKRLFSFFKNKEVEKVKKIFNTVLNNSMLLHYDPQAFVQPAHIGDGDSRILGAFILHELKQGTSFVTAKPVETPEQFKRFVINQLKKTKHILSKVNEENIQKQQEAVDEILRFVSRGDGYASSFIKSAIRCYDVNNMDVSDPLENWKQLEHLPFRDVADNNSATIYAKAIGISPGQPQAVRPKDAEELLNAFIAFGRAGAKENPFNEYNPYQHYMVKTIQHAFTLTPEDPSVLVAMDPSKKTEEWIQEYLIKPGKRVALQPATDNMKEKFREAICDKMLGTELRETFTQAAKKISTKYNTLSSYGYKLLKLLLKMSKQPTYRLENSLSRKLTEILLYDVMSPETAKDLISSAVRIATTHWVDKGAQQLSFACFYNPLACEIQLALLDEGGTRLTPLNQEEWVTYIPWEMYGIKSLC